MISFTITKFIPANVVITANFFPFFVFMYVYISWSCSEITSSKIW